MAIAQHKRRANSLTGKVWLQRSFSIWRNLTRTSEERKLEHPAVFPASLAQQIIECFTNLEAEVTVLDPFAGSGSTLLAAMNCGTKAVGIELNPEYKCEFMNRAKSVTGINVLPDGITYLCCDANDILSHVERESIDLCFTSPPYWNILHSKRTADRRSNRKYSEDSTDIGNIDDYQVFVRQLAFILNQVSHTLKDRAYLILNVMDIRKGPIFYSLHSDIIQSLEKSALELNDIIIWDRQPEYNSMRPLGYPHKFIVNKVHEYLLVFRKETKSQ